MDHFDLELMGLMFEPTEPHLCEEDENMGDEAFVYITEVDEEAYT